MAGPSSFSGTYKLCPRCRLIYPARTNFCVRDREPLITDARIIAGRYILLNQIGSGTMSEVYAAEQPQLGRTVAIKLLRRDPEVMRRFDSEVRAVGQIRHDHVVTIHDSGSTEDGRLYLAMEFLPGEDLASLLKRNGPMARPRAMLLWRQAVSAVAAAHRRQVVHRDIKPANLFVTYKEGDEGPEEIIKVIDFSIAKLVSPGRELRPTEPGAIVGTVLYMAPEQLESGEATPRSDVYSLGLVLMEMLTGRVLVDGGAAEPAGPGPAVARLLASPTSLPGLKPEPPYSEELQQLAGEVLSRDPSLRPRDAGELLRRIKQLPEMRKGQRLPRRLSWPSIPVVDPALAGLAAAPAADAPPPAQAPAPAAPVPPAADASEPSASAVSESQPLTSTGEVPAGGDYPVEPTAPDAGTSKTGWPLSSSGVPEVNDDWAEPTIPAGGSRAENHMRSLVATLLAESRQAYTEAPEALPEALPAALEDPASPAAKSAAKAAVAVIAPPAAPAAVATVRKPDSQPTLGKEDSNSNSSGNGIVWSAAELDRRLHAHDQDSYPPPAENQSAPARAITTGSAALAKLVADAAPDVISEQPTVPTPSAPVSSMVSDISEPHEDHTTSTISAISPAPRPAAEELPRAFAPPPRRTGRTWILLVLCGIVGIVAWGIRSAHPPAPGALDRQQGGLDLAKEDAAFSPPIDLTIDEVVRRLDGSTAGADLDTARDLASGAHNGLTADAGKTEADGVLRIRFVYNDEDEVEGIDCGDAPTKRTAAQNKYSVRVSLAPGTSCAITSTAGTRSYSYEQLAKFRPDRLGEIRFHVRGTAPGPAAANPATAAEPPRPPASGASESGSVAPTGDKDKAPAAPAAKPPAPSEPPGPAAAPRVP